MSLTRMPAVAGLLLAVGISATASRSWAANPTAKWVTFSNCRFIPESNRDADSFHVMTSGGQQFIFRLYFVDAPETDASLKERVREQAQHFGVSEQAIVQASESTKKFTAELLKHSFTVTTRWQNASGRSRSPRYYARIEIGGRDLGELLVTYGWARAKGTVAVLPDGTRAKDHMAKLQKLEAEAQSKRRGLWAQTGSK